MVREVAKSPTHGMLADSMLFLAKLGFPAVTTEDAPVATLFGTTPNILSDDEIRDLLKGGVFLDGESAVILTKRGFADLIGVEAEDDVDTKVSFAGERILSPAQGTFRGDGVFCLRLRPKHAPGRTARQSVFASLRMKPGAVAWSSYVDVEGEEVAPAVVSFGNAFGGRIGVMAQSVDVRPPHMSLYTPRKQELFHHLFTWLARGEIAVRAPKTPNTFVLASEKDGELLVMVNNLAGEPRDDVALEFAAPWSGRPVERLCADGSWRTLQTGHSFQPMEPEFLRVKGTAEKRGAER